MHGRFAAKAHRLIENATRAHHDASWTREDDRVAWNLGRRSSNVRVLVLEIDLRDCFGSDPELREIHLVLALKLAAAQNAREHLWNGHLASPPDHYALPIVQGRTH